MARRSTKMNRKQTAESKKYASKVREFMREQNLTHYQVCRAIGYTQFDRFKEFLNGDGNLNEYTKERMNTFMKEIHSEYYRTKSGQLRRN